MPFDLSWSILELFVELLIDQSLAVSTLLVDVIVEPLPIPFLIIHPSPYCFTIIVLMFIHHGPLPVGLLLHQLSLQIISNIIVILLSLVF